MIIKKNKIIIFIISIISIIISIFIVINFLLDKEVKASSNGIENFPESYQPYLEELAKKYPNWTFVALYTGLDWDYVIDQESEFGKNLVPINYSDSWKNTTPGQYNVEVDSGWVDSSRQAVEYCMDPRNFLNEVRIFQFETLSYDSVTNNLNSIEKILYGTEFYEQKVSYVTSSGNTVNMNETYSDLILKAGQTSLVSPYHLASRIKQEVGPFLSHSSISGIVEGFEGLYNFYNIGATSSSEPMGAIKNGLEYAKNGKNASEQIKAKYLIPWNTKEKAITGGGIFIGSSYINRGQNTIYLQKFHVRDTENGELFWHQYMTNVLAPYSESKSIYNGYQKTGLLDSAMTFIIPVYENMPDIMNDSPAVQESNFEDANFKAYCNATNVNIRTGPSTSYEVIKRVTKGDKMTVIKRGINSGEKWDKVILENGIIGYIFQTYVTESVEEEEEEINVTGILLDKTEIYLQVGESVKLNAYVYPDNATNKNILYNSSNEEVAKIDDTGTITSYMEGDTVISVISQENSSIKAECKLVVVSKIDDSDISFESPLKVEASEISGIPYLENKVVDIKNKINTNYTIEIVNKNNEILNDIDLITTGSKLLVKEGENLLKTYTFIIYGDVNGDGKINSVDLLVLQRHILEIEKIDGVYFKAGNIRKDGKKPTSVDLLLIQRHILGLQIIEQ